MSERRKILLYMEVKNYLRSKFPYIVTLEIKGRYLERNCNGGISSKMGKLHLQQIVRCESGY